MELTPDFEPARFDRVWCGECCGSRTALPRLEQHHLPAVFDEASLQRSNSTAVSGVEQQIKTVPSVGLSSGSGA